MSTLRKRFWKSVDIVEVEGGFAVQLDGRGIKTPAKTALNVPTRAIADMVAAEWDAQGDKIDPETMPATRAANAALDKVQVQFDDVASMLTDFGDTDLLCYRADGPEGLIARQAAAWDPLLAWSSSRFGVEWVVTSGVMPTAQNPETRRKLAAHIAGFSAFQMTAFHDLVSLPGSLVIGLAATEHVAPAQTLWEASRIDEIWQIEQWGDDEEAQNLAKRRHQAFLNAVRFYDACE
jgi:chaperone required for assembly of F1-ATPase